MIAHVLVDIMQGPVARLMAQAVARVACLGSARGHQARPYGTPHGMDDGMRRVSWFGSWAPCKAPWHGQWHALRVLA